MWACISQRELAVTCSWGQPISSPCCGSSELTVISLSTSSWDIQVSPLWAGVSSHLHRVFSLSVHYHIAMWIVKIKDHLQYKAYENWGCHTCQPFYLSHPRPQMQQEICSVSKKHVLVRTHISIFIESFLPSQHFWWFLSIHSRVPLCISLFDYFANASL